MRESSCFLLSKVQIYSNISDLSAALEAPPSTESFTSEEKNKTPNPLTPSHDDRLLQ